MPCSWFPKALHRTWYLADTPVCWVTQCYCKATNAHRFGSNRLSRVNRLREIKIRLCKDLALAEQDSEKQGDYTEEMTGFV